VAATPMRATAAEQTLEGGCFDDTHIAAAKQALASAFSPIDDHRGSAEYRAAMVTALFERFAHDLEVAS